MKFNKSRLWLCLPFILVFLCDASLTLSGQPSSYWQGNRQNVTEVFPLFAWALRHGPSCFVVICLLWIAIFCMLIVSVPSLIAEILSLALVNGHTWGTMTWLVYDMRLDYHLCLMFFVLSGTLFIVAYRKWKVGQQNLAPYR